jgi:hypothetical protein
MTHYEIKSWVTGAVLYAGEAETLRDLVATAVKRGANLRDADLGDANLGGANLFGANLGGAYLRGADLGGANLRGADLRGADLVGANLRGADLGGADLRGADLRDADLRDADLRGADLRDADLRGADLRDANLGGAYLRSFRADLWDVLMRAQPEIPALRAALVAGRVDGSVYEGPCSCLVGTIATARGCRYDAVDGVKPDSGRPAEKWFMCIRTGDTPETSMVVAQTVAWIDELTALLGARAGAQGVSDA